MKGGNNILRVKMEMAMLGIEEILTLRMGVLIGEGEWLGIETTCFSFNN
jgi:hypothetical protein